jgi:predicted Zn-dependent peptidase
LRSGDAFEAETVSDLAEWFGGFAVDADWRMLLDWEERRAAVNAKRVRATARQFLTRERRVVGWSLPGKES